MPTTLIVLAHPDSRSFNGQWADATEAAARSAGDTVLRSDLCQMGFDPVERSEHYPDWPSDVSFDPLKAQETAAQRGNPPELVADEVEKIRRADRIVLHFPLWWFAPPAILKGWFDRAFQHGALHDVDTRFDTGQFSGRGVLMCVTTGSSALESSISGKEGDVRLLLWPTAYTLRYLGFDVLEPVIVHSVHGYHLGNRETRLTDRLQTTLEHQADVIAGWDHHSRLPFNADADFDKDGTLCANAPSYWPFIRHGSQDDA